VIERHIEVTRTARYYVLGNETGSARDIWFVLHGYGQLARDFLNEFTLIETADRLVVAPEALSRFYTASEIGGSHAQSAVGATWMTREDRECEIEDYVRYLDRLHSAVAPNGSRVRLLGFSQGTATASRWAALGNSRFDELILWAGGFAEDLDLVRYRDRLSSMRIACVLGERDSMNAPDKVDAHFEKLREVALEVTLIRFSGGHRLDRDTLRKIAEEQ
jgi:predicted esterase